MAAYSDQEQLDAIKQWWADNGRSIIVGAILGFGALFGWRGWVTWQEHQETEASYRYAALQQLASAETSEAAAEEVERLKEDYSNTPYAALAALQLAAAQARSGELKAAEEQLRWAQENAQQQALRDLARLRLARVLLARQQPDDALNVLEADFPDSYLALVEELRGDALRAEGEQEAARAAYDRAIAASRSDNQYLRMKRDDLGATTDADSS